MNTSKFLPLLVAPALLLVAQTAEAAQLQLTSGSLSEQVSTEEGFDFALELHGVIVESTAPDVDTVVALDCSVDTTAHAIQCSGTLSLSSYSVAVGLDYDPVTEKARWVTAADISNGFKTAHKLWGAEIMPHVTGDGWDEDQLIVGSQYRVFWYPASWEIVWVTITGLPFDEFWEIWTW